MWGCTWSERGSEQSRGVFGVRREVDERFAVVENDGVPRNIFTDRQGGGCFPGRDTNTVKVTAVDVFFGAAAIGIEKDGLLVRRERPVLDFAISGSEELQIFSIDAKGIEMLPAVLVTGDNKTIAGGPVHYTAASVLGHFWK